MAAKPKTDIPAPFEFLSPLDGETYTLPPFDATLVFDAAKDHLDEIPALPPASEFYSKKYTPTSRRELFDEQRNVVTQFNITSMIETFNNHLSDPEDPAQGAVIAMMNALMWADLWRIYAEWAVAAGESVEDEQGEG